MAEKLFLEVSIEGLVLQSIRMLSISQRMFDHHSFELVIPSESIDKDIANVFKKIPDLIGKDIKIDWETGSFKAELTGTDASSFDGLIRDVSVSGDYASHMLVTIRGNSPTLLLDGVLHTDTYSELKPLDIYKRAIAGNLTSKVKMNDNLSFKDKLPFVIQYNETDFNFISRVMHGCGEWFFYDGQAVSLGLKANPAINLTKDKVFSLDFSFNIASPAAEIRARDYKKHEVVDIKGKANDHKDSIAKKVAKESLNLFPSHNSNFVTYPTYAEGESDQTKEGQLKKSLEVAKTSRSNDVFSIYGDTDVAELQLGSIIKLDGFAYGGEFLITELTHTCGGKDNYQNHFKAVPSDCMVPGHIDIKVPDMDDCVAVVTDNKDPEKMGRVKVQFDWGADESPWLRMLMPHTGKGRGFYFVPEINEEVMVGFEMGKADFPYVIGSLYNGKNKFDNHYEDKNKIKSIKTISGNEIIFNDHGSLTVRNGKNSIKLDCKDDGTLTITTEGDMVLEAKKNMSFTCEENMSIEVGKNFALNVKGNHEVGVMGDSKVAITGDLKQSGMNSSLSATQELKLDGGTKASIKAAQTAVEGSAQTEVKSSGITTVKGSLVQIN